MNKIYGVICHIKTRKVQPTPPPKILDDNRNSYGLIYVPSIGKTKVLHKKSKQKWYKYISKIFTYSGVCNENNCNYSRVGYANTRTA